MLPETIFSVNDATFDNVVLQLYRYQYENVDVYRQFCQSLKAVPDSVNTVEQIPFLPVEVFKTHEVISNGKPFEIIFESSGTTGSVPSRHYVADVGLYEKSFLQGFKHFYGEPSGYVILALLPAYLERTGSSLVYMADRLIQYTGKSESGFFLNEFEKLYSLLLQLKERKQKTLLLGVTFGLLDFAEQYKIDFPELIIMETGGMKGRRKELTRTEVHERLQAALGVKQIHSEYGMTELLSQGYSKGEGVFETPPWMKIITRDVYDPLKTLASGNAGAVNIIDLANFYSCAFIATNDLGLVKADGTFEVLGRMDNAEIRGCNLMVL